MAVQIASCTAKPDVILSLQEVSWYPSKWLAGCADLRGKELVMRLMMHPDQEVQKQALLCVRNIMLARDKLEFMNAS